MIKIAEDSYDNYIANRKTNSYDTEDDNYKDLYKRSKELLRDAEARNLPVIPYGGNGHCSDCKFASETVITNSEDDMDNHVCYAKRCPYGVWKITRDKYGNIMEY